MTIELNGEPVELTEGASVDDVVDRSGGGEGPRGVAVAVDGEVIPRAAWERTRLCDGQRVEIVGAIQGG